VKETLRPLADLMLSWAGAIVLGYASRLCQRVQIKTDRRWAALLVEIDDYLSHPQNPPPDSFKKAVDYLREASQALSRTERQRLANLLTELTSVMKDLSRELDCLFLLEDEPSEGLALGLILFASLISSEPWKVTDPKEKALQLISAAFHSNEELRHILVTKGEVNPVLGGCGAVSCVVKDIADFFGLGEK